MNNAMQSFLYGVLSILFAAAVAALCSGIRAAMKMDTDGKIAVEKTNRNLGLGGWK